MSFRVQLDTGEAFDVQAGQSLLSAALNASISLPSDCRQGACGTCRVKLLDGRTGRRGHVQDAVCADFDDLTSLTSEQSVALLQM